MSTIKHTPGPWSNTPGQCTIWANDGDLKVATVEDLPWIENASGRRSSDWMTEAANARLIAAAPELLEALRECITEDGAVAWRNAQFAGQRLEAISNIAKAAIAKAEGKL